MRKIKKQEVLDVINHLSKLEFDENDELNTFVESKIKDHQDAKFKLSNQILNFDNYEYRIRQEPVIKITPDLVGRKVLECGANDGPLIIEKYCIAFEDGDYSEYVVAGDGRYNVYSFNNYLTLLEE